MRIVGRVFIASSSLLLPSCGAQVVTTEDPTCPGDLEAKVALLEEAAAKAEAQYRAVRAEMATACVGIAEALVSSPLPDVSDPASVTHDDLVAACDAAFAGLAQAENGQRFGPYGAICVADHEAQFQCEEALGGSGCVAEVDQRCVSYAFGGICEGMCEDCAAPSEASPCNGQCQGLCEGSCNGACSEGDPGACFCTGTCEGLCTGLCVGQAAPCEGWCQAESSSSGYDLGACSEPLQESGCNAITEPDPSCGLDEFSVALCDAIGRFGTTWVVVPPQASVGGDASAEAALQEHGPRGAAAAQLGNSAVNAVFLLTEELLDWQPATVDGVCSERIGAASAQLERLKSLLIDLNNIRINLYLL